MGISFSLPRKDARLCSDKMYARLRLACGVWVQMRKYKIKLLREAVPESFRVTKCKQTAMFPMQWDRSRVLYIVYYISCVLKKKNNCPV